MNPDMFDPCPREQLEKYRRTFCAVERERGKILGDPSAPLPVVMLPSELFPYERSRGYEFYVAGKTEKETGAPMLLINITSFDPEYRRRAQPGEIDFVIPLAYEKASERERLFWTVAFGGAWSDTRDDGVFIFDPRWGSFFSQARDRLGFANPGSASAALFNFKDRDKAKVAKFLELCGGE